MSTFKLPDLGEGLADAEIIEWHVKPGDDAVVDQPMVTVETAKAVVEVPAPFSGRVMALHGAVGEIVATGAPLIDLDSDAAGGTPGLRIDARAGTGAPAHVPPAPGRTELTPSVRAGSVSNPASSPAVRALDSATVVGTMPTSDDDWVEYLTADRARTADGNGRRLAIPVARALAKRLGIDLRLLAGSGPDGVITLDDVLRHANVDTVGAAAAAGGSQAIAASRGASSEPLRGPRRAMAHSMSLARDQVSGSTVCDDADIDAWTRRGDYMLRLVRAMIAACAAEPALNAWYDSANESRLLLRHIDLAIAVDTPGGLIVPVLRDVGNQTPGQLRAAVAAQKEAAQRRSVAPGDLRDFTLMLSNFGTLAGRYGIPLVVPPAVAILGAGRVRRDAVVSADAAAAIAAHWRMPLSLSFDHRCVTGGEACRFLAAVIADLEKPD